MNIVPLPAGLRLTREFHVSADARRLYGLEDRFVDLRGRVIFADIDAAEAWAAAINDVRDARRFPESAVSGAELYAAGLLDEAMHLVLEAYRRERDPHWTASLLRDLSEAHGEQVVEAALQAFVKAYPTVAVSRGSLTPQGYLDGESDGLPNREVALEEWACLRVARENPALERLRDLFEAAEPPEAMERLAAGVDQGLRRFPAFADVGAAEAAGDLGELLRAPIRSHPTSLQGQLGYVREHWRRLLGARFDALWTRLLRATDLLAEIRSPGPPGPPGPAPVLDRAALGGREEAEAYSPDADWMPRVVLVAKSTYVWLDQLARRHRRDVTRLDQIPDEALDELVARGFSGLWLIGLWERSAASRRIKQRMGQEDAAASAYALYDYRIADDLGGEEAYRDLRDRAAARGLRLASDMVPNHVGIDGKWVLEHPEWFVQLDHPPYEGYSFTGPDLSDHPDVQVRLEDHYWDRSDAAVVFERHDPRSGERRYLYHGNDGTSMPWNDTAQLDYLRADVREAVVATVVEVARRFPIIRFDAAMTLAKQHVQRLWYPPPGQGGAIPSRSRYGALDDEEFERRMPQEFWREVVDRVAQEAPDTLLLAEAFWMMEGYFVRTLGMHRVYNSAFMNMLKREANADYRALMRNILAFDPRVLQRFVNFMNNPDEDTAIAQFGDGDKAFGVTTMMATMPGLPMFGHGQVEGLREKYGMEYRRARQQEDPDAEMVERHRREIAPLLRRRDEFAGVEAFRLYEFVGDDGVVHDDVFAYSNRRAGRAHLVLFHNRYAEARGRVRESVPYADPPGNEARQARATVAEGLGLRGGSDRFAILRDHRSGLEELHPSDALARDGLPVQLGAYETRVYLDVEEVRDAEGRYARLHDHLGGRRVASLDETWQALVLRPLHRAFARVLEARVEASRREALGELRRELHERLAEARLDEKAARERLAELDAEDAATVTEHDVGAFPVPEPAWRRAAALTAAIDTPMQAWEALRLADAVEPLLEPFHAGLGRDAWLSLMPLLLREEETAQSTSAESTSADATSADSSDSAPADATAGAEPPGNGEGPRAVVGGAPADADGTAAAPEAPAPSRDDGAGEVPTVGDDGEALVERWRGRLAEDRALVRWLQVHEHEGVRWFHRERFRAWVGAWSWWRTARGLDPATVRAAQRRWAELERASGYRFDRLRSSQG